MSYSDCMIDILTQNGYHTDKHTSHKYIQNYYENAFKSYKDKQINFVIANGENAADEGVGITEEIANDLFKFGVNVITTSLSLLDKLFLIFSIR